MKLRTIISLSLILFGASNLLADNTPVAPEAGSPAEFGPYQAVLINPEIVRNVVVDETLNVFLILNPDYKNDELRVKISNDYKASYRTWFTGDLELVSPANAGKPSNQPSDRLKTEAAYIEYWMNGELFLHLHRVR